MTLAPDARPVSSLEDRYVRESGTVFLGGIAALVRMVRDRALVDRRMNRPTASFISGYEGSPLAGYDLELARRRSLLEPLDIVHRPGLNEELAATSVMGSQVAAQVTGLAPDAAGRARSGIVGYWYGKAPGLDRASDALRHANIIGTHPDGGAVVLVGDDPGAKSSTVPCASEMALADLYIPTLYPADSQDILDLGVHAAHLSRVSGLWTSMKISAHVADGASTVHLDPTRITPGYGGLGRSPHIPSGRLLGANLMELEQNQLTIRMPRAHEYARLNGLNRIVVRSGDDRIGIVAAGKTYLDVREALHLMGLTEADLNRLGIRILKLGMIYPLERDILRRFITDTAAGRLDEVIVVEEKRDFIETMMRDILFRDPVAPHIVGKLNEDGSTLFSRFGELDVDAVTRGLATRLARHHHVDAAIDWLDRSSRRPTRIELPLAARTPYFCSGCPHNSSTQVPHTADEGAPDSGHTLVGAGIGCHAMVLFMDPDQVGDVTGVTQMGGEGAQWLGMAPFVAADHFIANLGDGTFTHSGSLAVRAAVAAGAHITYKLLYNGTVAMTGGQDPVGGFGLPQLTKLLLAEGVKRIVITSDDVARTRSAALPSQVHVRGRADLADVQRELATVDGVTVLIHDQQCAAEKRRKRKRGTMDTPTTRVMINERICEGCGDCGAKSNCLSVHPVETEFGRKTRIDQSSCNLDYSCLQGDCPSFVTITPGPTEAAATAAPLLATALPATALTAPAGGRDLLDSADGVATIRITGIGGSGVVTISQILATAATLDGHAARTVDMTGLAQKGGAVISDLKISRAPIEVAAKVATGTCDLYLACDSLVAADATNLKVAAPERTTAVVSTTRVPTGKMVVDTAVGFPSDTQIHDVIDSRVARTIYLDPGALSSALFAHEQYANMLAVGAAYQAGALPISAESLERAITLNGVSVTENIAAFRRGRQAVADPDAVRTEIARLHPAATEAKPSAWASGLVAALARVDAEPMDAELARTIAIRVDDLVGYSGTRCARDYLDTVARVHRCGAGPELTDAVARNLYKLTAYKDEYEVARLTGDPGFEAQVTDRYGSGATTAIRLHPPTIRSLGMKDKIALGPWARPALHTLARMKRLRGTPLDPFGRTEIRRTERALVDEYRGLLDSVITAWETGRVGPQQYSSLVELAGLPDAVRGYESIKMANVARYHETLNRMRTELGV
ncbi:indolepyruvate ferredoxin oxidoreductase family protein [Gordonia sp. DT30]|uniref:indolepyruvate ferredoxin oxidoreductase family protein n=1 Tax=Gordonia sp. DT30 TaxID=3416546 RepID=UPI003CEE5F18